MNEQTQVQHRQLPGLMAAGDPRYAALRHYGGDAGSQPDPAISGTTLGAQANPLRLDQKALATVHQAMSTRQSVETKAFSTLDSLIPAQLDPNILPKIHEHRLLDYLPVQTISAPCADNFGSQLRDHRPQQHDGRSNASGRGRSQARACLEHNGIDVDCD